MIDIPLLLVSAVAVALGGFVQGAVGFGCGTIAVPIMVSAGIPVPESVTIVYLAVTLQCAHGWFQNRGLVRWRETSGLFLLRLLTLPIGIYLMSRLLDSNDDRVRQTVGAMMLLALVLQWIRVTPRPRVPIGWTILAGSSSGVLAGLMGMGAAPLVLWTGAHDWSGDRVRTYLWMMFLQVTPLHLLLMTLQFGERIPNAILPGLICSVFCLGGAMLGHALGRRMSIHLLRNVSYAIILMVALYLILRPGPR